MELLIAIFILVVVLTTVYASYSGTFRIVQEVQDDSGIYSMARETLERMIHDLQSVTSNDGKYLFVSSPSLRAGYGYVDLTIASRAHLAFSENENPSSIAEITYFIEEDSEEGGYRLMRRDRLIWESDPGDADQSAFVICKGVQSIAYTFTDPRGREYQSWDSTAGMAEQIGKVPVMAAVELKLHNKRDKDRPYVFSTKVFLPMSTVQVTVQ